MTKIAILYKMLGLAFLVAILSFAYQYDLHPQYSTYLDSHLASRRLKQNLDQIKQDAAKRESYSTQFTEIQTEFNKKMVVIPKAQDFNAALETVKKAGNDAQLQILSITPSSSTYKDFYTEVPVQITLVGTYEHILDFMQTTSTWSGPFFIWKNWTLAHQFKPKTTVLNETENNDLLQMNVNAVFFYLP